MNVMKIKLLVGFGGRQKLGEGWESRWAAQSLVLLLPRSLPAKGGKASDKSGYFSLFRYSDEGPVANLCDRENKRWLSLGNRLLCLFTVYQGRLHAYRDVCLEKFSPRDIDFDSHGNHF